MNNQTIVDTDTGANHVNQRTGVVDMVPPSYLVFGVLPFPVEVHGHSNLLVRRKPNPLTGEHDCMPISLGDFAIRP